MYKVHRPIPKIDKSIYQTSGPVTTYRVDPADIIALYGPPVMPLKRRR